MNFNLLPFPPASLLLAVFLLTACSSEHTTGPLSKAEIKAQQADIRKRWEASPDGIKYRQWQDSQAGKRVRASHEKIRGYIQAFAPMEAEVCSLTFKRENKGASSPEWLLIKIEGEEYMMQFSPGEFDQLKSLKVKDKIMVKSRSAGFSPNHPFLILSGDYIARNKELLFQRKLSKNKGC